MLLASKIKWKVALNILSFWLRLFYDRLQINAIMKKYKCANMSNLWSFVKFNDVMFMIYYSFW